MHISAGELELNVETPPTQPAAPSPPPLFNRDTIVKNYEARLLPIKYLALFSTGLYSLNWFLGLSALTWASVCGFLINLGKRDFYSVSAMLLLEVLRLATTTFFGNLVTRKLIYRSTLPAHIKYDDNVRHRILAGLRSLDLILQLPVLAVSIYLPLSRLPPSLPWQCPDKSSSDHFDGLCHSLHVFYILILLNAFIAVVGLLHSKALVPLFATSFSLQRYYDHVVWRGMDKGFLYTTDFDFLAFAFKALADEYRRNLRATVVYKHYHDLIEYIYSHKRGYDATRIAMDSSDHCEQEAAANLVGLWAAKIEGAGSPLLLQSRLLTKLADCLDHQETGRAATCSFESLAKSNAEGVLEVKNEKGDKMMGILSECIGKAVKAKKEDKALVFMKLLIQLLGSEAGKKEAAEAELRMVENVRMVLKGQGCKKRTLGVAGKALTLMGEAPSAEEVEEIRKGPLPSADEHYLEDEGGYLKDLLDEIPLTWKTNAQARGNTAPDRASTDAVSCLLSLLPVFVLPGIVLCAAAKLYLS